MSKIVDRVRKLLELAKRNDSPAEAAQAAAHAQELMFKHQIGEADLEAVEPNEPESIEEQTVDQHKGKRRSMWKAYLIHAVADSMGCKAFTLRGNGMTRFQVYGPVSTVQTVQYLYSYLGLEITRMCEESYRKAKAETRDSAQVWRNNYRMGAIGAIRKRLTEQRAEQQRKVDDLVKAGQVSTALALYTNTAARTEAGYKDVKKKHGLGSGRSSSYRSSPSAYAQGREAGRSLSLGGGKGLPASPNRLEG